MGHAAECFALDDKSLSFNDKAPIYRLRFPGIVHKTNHVAGRARADMM
jgi:hypothetical protein